MNRIAAFTLFISPLLIIPVSASGASHASTDDTRCCDSRMLNARLPLESLLDGSCQVRRGIVITRDLGNSISSGLAKIAPPLCKHGLCLNGHSHGRSSHANPMSKVDPYPVRTMRIPPSASGHWRSRESVRWLRSRGPCWTSACAYFDREKDRLPGVESTTSRETSARSCRRMCSSPDIKY
jgi:hypothetical protein